MNESDLADLLAGIVIETMMEENDWAEECGIDAEQLKEMRRFFAAKLQSKIGPEILEHIAENIHLDDSWS